MSANVKDIVSWLSVLGLPTIVTMTAWCVAKCRKFAQELKILMEAQQKQMARDLTNDYKIYMKQGYIEDDDLRLWEENYQKYHSLGANGIMDKKRERLINLPIAPDPYGD